MRARKHRDRARCAPTRRRARESTPAWRPAPPTATSDRRSAIEEPLRWLRGLALMRLALVLALVASAALAKDRVSTARLAQTEPLKKLFADAGLTYPPDELYLRAFKEEKELEVW